jgi:hypothetical protein
MPRITLNETRMNADPSSPVGRRPAAGGRGPRDPQKQAALDRELFVFADLVAPDRAKRGPTGLLAVAGW